MAKGDKTAVAVERKPRVDDMFVHDEVETSPGVRQSPMPGRGMDGGPTPAPVLVTRPPDGAVDPDDVDRPMRRQSPDWLSHELGDPNFISPAYFEWSKSGAGVLHRYSRRYTRLDVIVDFFTKDSDAVRLEVERKRERIVAHNKKAREDLASVEKIYQDKLRNAKSDAAKDVAHEWKRASIAYRRREGMMPHGYLPILTGKPIGDLAAAKKGDVLDLPPAAPKEGFQVGGVGVSGQYV